MKLNKEQVRNKLLSIVSKAYMNLDLDSSLYLLMRDAVKYSKNKGYQVKALTDKKLIESLNDVEGYINYLSNNSNKRKENVIYCDHTKYDKYDEYHDYDEYGDYEEYDDSEYLYTLIVDDEFENFVVLYSHTGELKHISRKEFERDYRIEYSVSL